MSKSKHSPTGKAVRIEEFYHKLNRPENWLEEIRKRRLENAVDQLNYAIATAKKEGLVFEINIDPDRSREVKCIIQDTPKKEPRAITINLQSLLGKLEIINRPSSSASSQELTDNEIQRMEKLVTEALLRVLNSARAF